MDRKLEIADQRIAELEKKLDMAEKDLVYYRRVSRDLTHALSELGVKVWSQSDVSAVASSAVKETKDLIEKGRHMAVLHEAIKSNDVVADGWKKFMVTLRLCGLDGTNPPESN